MESVSRYTVPQEAVSAKEETEASKEANKCGICTSREANAAMLACGHVLCDSCASDCRPKCPFCRKNSNFMRLYR